MFHPHRLRWRAAAAPIPGLPNAWGVTAVEWAASYPADARAQDDWVRMLRGASSDASPAQLWPWLCQLRVAPYSYDLLDNRGRRSPRTLTPGLTDLAIGQKAVAVFTVAGFVEGESITLTARPGSAFGRLAMSWSVVPDGAGSRLIACLRHPRHRGPMDRALAWGDLVMMRKQLRTLTRLAEG
ncbi:MAG: hypothetical protein JWO46_642 [Nocardioidaceae bacterium]|nr:hypothetical protein [Nocardioidaceae bacterium]